MQRFQVFVMLLVVLLSGAACSNSPQSNFYTLDVVYDGPGHDFGEHRIGVGPFELPPYLDRPQIVTRGNGNRLVISEFNRWGDSLNDRFEAVLVRNLVVAGDSAYVLSHPWRREFRTTFRVAGVVDRFEAGPDGTVVLEVRWAILDRDGDNDGEIGGTFRSVYTQQAPPGDYAAIASAMSRTIAGFAEEIAVKIAATPVGASGPE